MKIAPARPFADRATRQSKLARSGAAHDSGPAGRSPSMGCFAVKRENANALIARRAPPPCFFHRPAGGAVTYPRATVPRGPVCRTGRSNRTASVHLIWCSAAGSELNRPIYRATAHNDEENQRGRARFSKVNGWCVFSRSSKRPLDRASREVDSHVSFGGRCAQRGQDAIHFLTTRS